jgi:replication factor A2
MSLQYSHSPAATDFAPAVSSGGFLQSPNFDSPTQQKPFKAADAQTLTPLTIRMMWNAIQGSDEVFRVDGQPLVQVTFIGKVILVDESNSTNISYKIDDGTGHIDVKVWLETDDSGRTQQSEVIEPNTYVRVYGHLRNWQNSLNVVAFRIMRLESHNELTFHLLEVIRVHLFNTKGPLPPVTQLDTQAAVVTSPISAQQSTPAAVGRMSIGSTEQLNEIQRAIFQVLRNARNPTKGAERTEIIQALSQKWSPSCVSENLQYLVQEGRLFTTVDEDHFSTGAA